MKLSKNIQTFIGCHHEYEESQIVLFGAPFDSTTSIDQVQDLQVLQFVEKVLELKLIVHVLIRILWI